MEAKDLTPRQRMQIPRQSMPEQKPEIRRTNFNEVPLGYDEQTAITEADRCIKCKVPHCIDGCPVNIDIPGFLELITRGEFAAAARKIKETNVLPAVCGRVCPQENQCEAVCVVGKKYKPVAIGRLERFVADYERTHNLVVDPVKPKQTGCKIAVVGSGPAGLTVASEMARRGHQVVVYEALHQPGGVLFYGIPRFRLPGDVIKSELEYLKKMGVEIHVNTVIGKLATPAELMKDMGFDAVFLGTGAGLPRFPNVPGQNFNGIYSANEYLTRLNLMRADRFPEAITPLHCGKRVAVFGAGNTAMDGARTSIRMGPESVTVYYRRTREEAPARTEELEHAIQEGVKFEWLTAPLEFYGDDNFFVKGARLQRMKLGEPDESGRRRPVPMEGSEFDIEVDTVVFALGFGVNPLILEAAPDLKTNRWGIVEADKETGMTSIDGVFAGGDIITGGATVILAMGQAKIAARGMHNWLINKKGLDMPRELPPESATHAKSKTAKV
jgi:glutamate synthase (NADPH/NADH) small chain